MITLKKRKIILIFTLSAIIVCGKIYTTYAPLPEEDAKTVSEFVTEKKDFSGLDFDVQADNDKYNSLNTKNIGWGF